MLGRLQRELPCCLLLLLAAVTAVLAKAPMLNLSETEARAGLGSLAEAGEMGVLFRAADWSVHPLGPPASWPEELRLSIRIILNSGHPMYIFWGPDALCFYNDAYRRSIGSERHPSSLGQPAREVWSEVWDVVGPQIAQVMRGGPPTWHENQLIPITRGGQREDVYWTYSYSPIGADGAPFGVGGVLVVCTETTETVLVQRRQSLLAELGADLARLSTPEAVLDAAVRRLGRHLQASRVSYGEVLPGDMIALTANYVDGVQPLAGTYPLSSFGDANIEKQRRGVTVACDDIAADGRNDTGIWRSIDTAAFVSAPLVRNGIFQGSLYVSQREKRHWSVADIALIEAVAARIRDTLERAVAETALRESEARFRAALQVTGIMWTNDAEGRMAGEQPGWSALTGQTPAEYAGYGWSGAVHRDDAQPTVDAWNLAVAERRMFIFEHRVRVRDGSYRRFAIRAAPVLGGNGAVREWVGVHVDITDQRAAEAKLRELNATLEQRVHERTRERDRMWTHSRDLLMTLDMAGTLCAVNPAFSNMVGVPQEGVVGRSIFNFIHKDDHSSSVAAWEKADGLDLVDYRNRYAHQDGSLRTISWYTHAEGQLVYAYGRDITAECEKEEALARAEEQLRQSQKMEAVGQLTGGLAHDFNNLLTGIAGSLELLETRLAQGRTNDLGRFIAGAQGAARRAAALTQRLLAFSRRQTLDPRPTDTNRLVAGMDDLIRRAVGPTVRVEVALDPGLWTCLVDPHQLENALLNLCINGRDAMPDGGKLSIHTANHRLDEAEAGAQDMPPGDYISLAIIDTGTGMTPQVVARAFDPFFTTKPLGEGTGLGLSMVYGFARQSGGQIRIHTVLGQGTTMCFYLPRVAAVALEEPASPAIHLPAMPAARETVLVVDDEATIRMLLGEVLQEQGYRVLEASDGAGGLQTLESQARIDLLITDVGLPGGMNGRQLADAGRVLRPGLNVLFITGYAETAVLGDGRLEAGMAVLTKPFTMETLGAKIRDLVDGNR